jgi:hypothetical protein
MSEKHTTIVKAELREGKIIYECHLFSIIPIPQAVNGILFPFGFDVVVWPNELQRQVKGSPADSRHFLFTKEEGKEIDKRIKQHGEEALIYLYRKYKG